MRAAPPAYRCAGAAAAIEAADTDPGARLLIVEKAPAEFVGGNARVSGQSLLISKNAEALKTYHRAMSANNPVRAVVSTIISKVMGTNDGQLR